MHHKGILGEKSVIPVTTAVYRPIWTSEYLTDTQIVYFSGDAAAILSGANAELRDVLCFGCDAGHR